MISHRKSRFTSVMVKLIVLFGYLVSFHLISSFIQLNSKIKMVNDYTFCYENISITLFDGGRCEQVRYGLYGKVLKKITGEWTAYGSPTDLPGQTIKIQFEGSEVEYSYDLIRDGFGNPSVLLDGQGRKYTLCKKNSKVEQNTNDTPQKSSSEFTGTFVSPDKSLKIIVTYKGNNQYLSTIFKNGKKVVFTNSCGKELNLKGEEVETYMKDHRGVDFYLSSGNCERQVKYSLDYSTFKYDPGLFLKTNDKSLISNEDGSCKLSRIK